MNKKPFPPSGQASSAAHRLRQSMVAHPGEWLFALLALTGMASSFATCHLMNGFAYNSGKNMIGAYVPPFLCVLYVTSPYFTNKIPPAGVARTLLLYFLQILPFAPLFTQLFQPTPGDDFSRYVLYARNMVQYHTLWGGDQLVFSHAGLHYVTQPGYRYFVYAELLLFHNLYRVTLFFNIALYLTGTVFFARTIRDLPVNDKLRQGFWVLLLLFTPYAVKNCLMGLSEWITALLLIMSCYTYRIAGHRGTALFLLALVPFFRQNLLVSVLLLAAWLLLHSSQRVIHALCFLLPLLLPLYHNLYYAGEWKFFVDVFTIPFLTYSGNGSRASGIDWTFLFNNIVQYAGVDAEKGKMTFSPSAFLFLPYSVWLYVVCLRTLPGARFRVFFGMITLSAVVPAIFLGSAYFPRFEFTNVLVMMSAYLLLTSPGYRRMSTWKFRSESANTGL